MTKRVTKYGALSNKSVLFLTKDKKMSTRLNKSLFPYIGEFDINESVYEVESFFNYDLLIVDIDFFDLEYLNNVLFKHKLDSLKIPVIYLTSTIDNNILEQIENVQLQNILLKGIQLDYIHIYISLVIQKSNIIYFNFDYSFCLTKNRFYHKQKEVSLTNLELALLKYLVENKNRVVEYDKIEKSVWDNKKCSIFSMRNVINKIREKSYYQIIENVSNRGYIVKDYKIY